MANPGPQSGVNAWLEEELLRHGMKERLDRFHDFFPGTGGVGVGSAFGMGTRDFGFSSQHRPESNFLIERSQTCYIFAPATNLPGGKGFKEFACVFRALPHI